MEEERKRTEGRSEKNSRITEWLRLERTSWGHLDQLPFSSRSNLSTLLSSVFSWVLNISQYSYHFSGKLMPVSHYSQSITIVLCLDAISSISVCAHWLLLCHCTPQRRVRLSHLHSLKSRYLYTLPRLTSRPPLF